MARLHRCIMAMLMVLLLSMGAPMSVASATLEWDLLQSGDIVYDDTVDVLNSACIRADDAGSVQTSFNGQEVATLQQMANDTGRRAVLVRSLDLAASVDEQCTWRVVSKIQEAYLCDVPLAQSSGSPTAPIENGNISLVEDLAGECTLVTFQLNLAAVRNKDQTSHVEGRYRIMACCSNWWLTYQKSTLDYKSSGDSATYLAGAFRCTGNPNHMFYATECKYENWVPGPGSTVGFKSRGHFVQSGGPFNFLKWVDVRGHEDGGSDCEFKVSGVYPWSSTSSRHKKACVTWVDPN